MTEQQASELLEYLQVIWLLGSVFTACAVTFVVEYLKRNRSAADLALRVSGLETEIKKLRASQETMEWTLP